MLGNRQEDTAARLHRAKHLTQHRLVLVDVLEDVECADHVELAVERNAPGIHLEERYLGETRPGEREALVERLAPHEVEPWERVADTGQDVRRAAPDLEKGTCGGKISLQRPDQQAVAGPEPEVLWLERGQLRKGCSVEAVVFLREVRREYRPTVVLCW